MDQQLSDLLNSGVIKVKENMKTMKKNKKKNKKKNSSLKKSKKMIPI